MNWPIVFILALPSILMGFLSLKGLTQNREVLLWFTLGALSIFYIFFNIHSHPFYHIFIVGILWGVINAAIQVLFYDMYMAHNPKAAASYGKLAKTLNPKLTMFIIGVATGAGFGFGLGAISWILKKFVYFPWVA